MTQAGSATTRRRGAFAAFAAVPLIALAAAAAPCACPDHVGHGSQHAAHEATTPAERASMTAMAHHAGPDGSRTAPAGATHRAASHRAGRMAMRDMAWVVGTPQVPIVLRQDAGPLALGDAPTPAPVALAARAASTTEPVAQRAELTVEQATAKLSRRCRKLVKAKRPSRLSKSDRRRRAACLEQRRQLIADSKTQPGTPAPTPTPTPAPVPTAAPTTPGSATPTPTPAPSTSPCAGKNPCYGAVGVTAIDSGTKLYFTLTRGSVMADRVSFEFSNTDSQSHNLFIEEKGKPETQQPIVADLAMKSSKRVDMALAPGTYTLKCTIPGHESMVVDFTVTAPVR